MREMKICCAALGLFFSGAAISLEKDYLEPWCAERDGVTEYRLPDDTRVDCELTCYSVEFDHAERMYEAVGQSLHYSRMTGKRAGIALILDETTDSKYLKRLNDLIYHYRLPIDVWEVR